MNLKVSCKRTKKDILFLLNSNLFNQTNKGGHQHNTEQTTNLTLLTQTVELVYSQP